MSVLASVPLARAAALLNDSAQSAFTNTALVPYLQTALDELREAFEDNNIPATNETSAVIPLTIGQTDIGGSGPALPTDLIEIQGVFERLTGSTDDFELMQQVEFLPPLGVITEDLIYWTWTNQIIKFLGALTNRDIKIQYIGNTIGVVNSASDSISVINATSFLAYRTASLAATYIGENPTRGGQLQSDAMNALDRLINLSTKGRQAEPIRRRPFQQKYKVCSSIY